MVYQTVVTCADSSKVIAHEVNSGSPEANLGSPEAKRGSPEAKSGSPEAKSGSAEANSGSAEANFGSQGANSWLSRGQLKLPSCKFDIFILGEKTIKKLQ